HLLDRFDFEFFGVTLTTHDTSYLGLIMRLGGVYETRGDSHVSNRSESSEAFTKAAVACSARLKRSYPLH
ncbi:hypothetical protein AAEJ67_15645, partial [Pseudomonas putida]